MAQLNPGAADNVHYATDPRIRHLAEAAWRMRTGGTRTDWLRLGKDNPEALIREAREWMRAAVATGLLAPPTDSPDWKASAWRAADADEPIMPALAVACPSCGSAPGALCTSHGGTRPRRHDVHQTRTAAHAAQQTRSTQ